MNEEGLYTSATIGNEIIGWSSRVATSIVYCSIDTLDCMSDVSVGNLVRND